MDLMPDLFVDADQFRNNQNIRGPKQIGDEIHQTVSGDANCTLDEADRLMTHLEYRVGVEPTMTGFADPRLSTLAFGTW